MSLDVTDMVGVEYGVYERYMSDEHTTSTVTIIIANHSNTERQGTVKALVGSCK